ncbi:hypothetical protein E2C01_003220 [Portunus trituberculatus]|uniref:Uncharacterized protein n=1 Tax=Portunus trituberculatus TaxID=210409 RepID=A0A5B7CSY9_PORTR|nr:hypothetical protein [Portunus trituberculatus]
MVQEHSYNSYSSYVPDPQDSKSTYKAMVTDKHTSFGQKQAAATTTGGNKNKKSKTDVWGPIYQNRQHFVDMHIC